MIEAPEAVCLARQLNETIKGKRVTYVLVRHTPHKFTFSCGNPDEYPEMLQDKIVGESCAYGGMVQVNAGDVKLVFTDGARMKVVSSFPYACTGEYFVLRATRSMAG